MQKVSTDFARKSKLVKTQYSEIHHTSILKPKYFMQLTRSVVYQRLKPKICATRTRQSDFRLALKHVTFSTGAIR
jgi:hypothetical protein